MTMRVLLVDDDSAVRDALGQTLELADLNPVLAGSYIEAKDHITPDFTGVVVSDIRMPGKDGFALLEYAHGVDPDLPVVLLTGEGDVPTAVRGMAAGAFDFLEKPCAPSDLLAVVERALKTRALVLENRSLKAQVEAGDAAARLLRGTSALSSKMRTDARKVAQTMADVLITGEPGVGTAKMAEVIHLLSAVSRGPFVKIAGAGTDPDMLHARFDEAEGGSLFIDEVAGLGQPAQFALLERLEVPAAPRVLAGTYHDLDARATAGTFNPDLYYRLEAARIHIPPLRDRREDIPTLFRHYVAIACEQAALPAPEVPQEVTQRLMAQDWPGNARALMNAAMRYAMGLSEPDAEGGLGLTERMAEVERAFLVEALRTHRGRASDTAQSLGLPRKTFYDKLARHGLKPEDFRA